MQRQVFTDKAPPPIGPYSQAIRAGDFLFVAGIIPTDPATGKVVEGGIEVQAARVLSTIEAILNVENLTFDNVVRVEIFLKDLKDLKTVNSLYSEKFLKNIWPARQSVEVSRLPLDVLLEISCIAFRKED